MTHIAKVAQAVLMMTERPVTCNDVSIYTGVGPEQVRRWMHKLTKAGIAVRTTVPQQSWAGRKHVSAWTIAKERKW